MLRTGASGVIPILSAVQILGGTTSTLEVNGTTQNVGSLSGTGNLHVNGGTFYTGNDNTSTTFYGSVQAGSGIIVHQGMGTWTLAGASPAYVGSINSVSGTLLLTGEVGSAISVTGSTLGGTGSANGGIFTTNNGSGNIAPGASPGRLTAGGFVLAPVNTLRMELNGATAGTAYDQIVTTTATLGGTLVVTLGYAPAVGTVFRLIDNTGALPVSGTFAGLAEGAVITVAGTKLRLSYVGGTGNDVTLTVVGVPSITTTSPLPSAVTGTPYSTTIAGAGGVTPYTWAVTAGSLPTGLTLNPGTGAITGTATAAGTSNFTITLTDAIAQTASTPFALTVITAVPPLSITTSSLPGGMVGAAYAATVTASGGTPPYTWSIASGALPPGITLDATTGALSGTPTTPGTYAFSLQVTDSALQVADSAGGGGTVRAIAPKAAASAPFTIAIAAAAPVATAPVPTLGEWMLALLALLTGAAGMLAVRRP